MPSDDQVSKKPKLQANLLPEIAPVIEGVASVGNENFES